MTELELDEKIKEDIDNIPKNSFLEDDTHFITFTIDLLAKYRKVIRDIQPTDDIFRNFGTREWEIYIIGTVALYHTKLKNEAIAEHDWGPMSEWVKTDD